MSKGKWKLKKVDDNTTENQKAIVSFLLKEGHSASRVNTTGQFEVVGPYYSRWNVIQHSVQFLKSLGLSVGFWRKSGSRIGFYDIVACLKCASGRGQYLAIDLKFSERDKLSEEQIAYANEVIKAGGWAFAMKDYCQFLDWYENTCRPQLNKL